MTSGIEVFFFRIYSYTVHIAVALQRNFSLNYSYIATVHTLLTKILLFTVHDKYASFEQINNTCVYHATIFANYPYKIFIQFTILFICVTLPVPIFLLINKL